MRRTSTIRMLHEEQHRRCIEASERRSCTFDFGSFNMTASAIYRGCWLIGSFVCCACAVVRAPRFVVGVFQSINSMHPPHRST